MPKPNDLLNVFDTVSNEYILLNATRQKVEKTLDIDGAKISYNLYTGYKIRHRYILERVVNRTNPKNAVKENPNEKQKIPQYTLDEWDRVRLMLNPKARV